MSLEPIQKRLAEVLRNRRSAKSFVGGSSVFNATFPRISDDIDIYVEDIGITAIAEADLKALEAAGLQIKNRQDHYGFAIEAIISDGQSDTNLEWNEADRHRFFPIQKDPVFGWSLHRADLSVQKLVAAASRRMVRDIVDIDLINTRYMPLAAIALAAPAKMPGISPTGILERVRQIAMGHTEEDYKALRLDAGAELPPLGQFKLGISDTIQAAIDVITDRCWKAEPGHLYIDKTTGKIGIPTNEALDTMAKQAASEKGTVPFLGLPRATVQAPSRRGGKDGPGR